MTLLPSADSRTRLWWPRHGRLMCFSLCHGGDSHKKSRPKTVDVSGEGDWELKSILLAFGGYVISRLMLQATAEASEVLGSFIPVDGLNHRTLEKERWLQYGPEIFTPILVSLNYLFPVPWMAAGELTVSWFMSSKYSS